MSSGNPYQSPTATTPPPVFDGERNLSWILFGFQGRIPRRIYWAASLASSFVAWLLIIILYVAFGQDSIIARLGTLAVEIPLIWISLAVQIKRWHDRDKVGWWVLITLVPLIGAIWAFIECGCLRGTFGPNRFGADPT